MLLKEETDTNILSLNSRNLLLHVGYSDVTNCVISYRTLCTFIKREKIDMFCIHVVSPFYMFSMKYKYKYVLYWTRSGLEWKYFKAHKNGT